jgi:hypothetical protein
MSTAVRYVDDWYVGLGHSGADALGFRFDTWMRWVHGVREITVPWKIAYVDLVVRIIAEDRRFLPHVDRPPVLVSDPVAWSQRSEELSAWLDIVESGFASREEAGKALKVPPATWYRWRDGHAPPAARRYVRTVARVFEVAATFRALPGALF